MHDRRRATAGRAAGPATNHAGVAAPHVGVIVQGDDHGRWLDSLGRDWATLTRFQLLDQDVFAIDAASLAPTASFAHVGTTLFNLAVNPASGAVYVSNTESRNDLRFEGPGTFAGTTLQGHLAETRITVIRGTSVAPRHLNKHIDYTVRPAPPAVKQRSLSTPLDMAVSADGATLYVAAFGSGKIGVLSTAQLEADTFDPAAASAGYLAVTGGGPSGLALDGHGHLLVATRFDDGVSMLDLASGAETSHVQLANPESAAIRSGRSLLYDAQATSSNGEVACASCHMFGDTDHLVWDLGNPDGDVVTTPISIRLQIGAAEVVAAVATVGEAEQALAPQSGAGIDAAFVDVQLSGRSDDHGGLTWVRRAAADPRAPMFVLATAYKQHAIEAYDLGVSDYLVKPFTPQRVAACVQRLIARGQPRDPAAAIPLRIAARRQRAIVFLGLDEVWACEAADRLTYVHSARGRYDLDLTLSAIGASFGRTLLRVHRSWLVNAARVLELEREGGEINLLVGIAAGSDTTGVRVPVAKERAVEVRELLLATARGVRQT